MRFTRYHSSIPGDPGLYRTRCTFHDMHALREENFIFVLMIHDFCSIRQAVNGPAITEGWGGGKGRDIMEKNFFFGGRDSTGLRPYWYDFFFAASLI